MRGAFWAIDNNQIETYNRAMFNAVWAEGKDLSSKTVLEEVLAHAGFDTAEVMEAMTQAENKTALLEATEAAVQRGVFGAPTFFVGDDLFFGQDRLEWVESALC